MKTQHPSIRWLIWSFAALFYFYEFVLRVFPSIIVSDLMAAFSIDAALVGLLTAGYLYVYAPMQLPAGILLDRYGARNLLTFGTLACGLGSLLFAIATMVAIAFSGRALMGFGSAFAFVGLVYVSSHWFSGRVTTLLIGIGNSIGMLGAMWGEAILGYLNNLFGWRVVSLLLAAIGLLLAFSIYFLFKRFPTHNSHLHDRVESFSTVWENFKCVIKEWQTWLNASVSFLIYLTTVAFAGLWGPSFLQVVYGYGAAQAGLAMSIFYLGWVVGGPITGWIVGRAISRKALLVVTAALAGIILLAIIQLPLDRSWLLAALFFVGFFSSSQLLTFSYAILVNPEDAKGTAVAFTNFAVMAAGAIVQPLIGVLLDVHALEVSSSKELLLTAVDFKFAMTLFPISLFLGAILSLFLKGRKSLRIRA